MRRYFFAMTTLYIAATVVQTSIVAGGLRWDESTLLRAVTLAVLAYRLRA
mgnify:CR=1 FL=1